ncbi:cation diffusion facilitator family transporter [Actinomadura sp. DC4]|uniref:cation diffusion facilitator family transporter n=1 Tax=Actinomadura sp. DC4 TaxID=3055069 RepID=UPI0025AF03B2|nr:cation diffusion facilitator family transporter [Actinomadura sp. DC4]MDN3355530.1 cation diffusion facilitator family transporter [Actinomadura sp. DC4]
MSAEGGSKAIAAALGANLGIALAKFVAFAFTGSASMMAEGVHSIADSGNQGLLILGRSRSRRAETSRHPFGYGRERFFYAFIVAVVLFTVGALFSLYEGWHKISDPHDIDDPIWAFGVLGLGILLEGYSFRTAIKESNLTRGKQSWVTYIRRARAPELPVVILEDFAALIGLVVALVCVGLAVITGDGVWDGVGSVVIGLLLAFVAIVLAVETKSMLIGESAVGEIEKKIVAELESVEEIDRVIHLRTLHIGPEELLVAVKIAVTSDDTAAEVARGIDAAESRIREAVPEARHIYIEPDLDRARSRPENAG